MPLVCLELSHRTAPVEVRERHAFPNSKLGEALIALRDYDAVVEAAILATCGRLEIYAELTDYDAGVAQLKDFLINFRHAGIEDDLTSYMYTLLGSEAINHLFRVATGLDSMLVGEAEILGQVKDCYIEAQRAKSLGSSLHRLFRGAINAGKAARSQTSIGRASVSVATAAIEMAKRHVGTLKGKNVVVVGAGKMGATAARRLKLESAHLLILNRSHERAAQVIEELGTGFAGELPVLSDALRSADVVITSTGASHFILDPGKVAEAMLARPGRPMFVVDIAVPRDVDPEVARIPGVAVADIDRLAAVVDDALEVRRKVVPLVEEIIAEHVRHFTDWYRSRVVVPVIASLTQKADTIRQAEIDRLFARCPDLTDRERKLIAGMSLTIVSKLLHSVITNIRESSSAESSDVLVRAQMLGELFELRAATPEAAGAIL